MDPSVASHRAESNLAANLLAYLTRTGQSIPALAADSEIPVGRLHQILAHTGSEVTLGELCTLSVATGWSTTSLMSAPLSPTLSHAVYVRSINHNFRTSLIRAMGGQDNRNSDEYLRSLALWSELPLRRIRAILSGDAVPTLEELTRLAHALRIQVQDLVAEYRM